MKLEATVVFKLHANSLAEAGALLDDVLGAAHEREGIEVGGVDLTTPPGAAPVSLPAVPTPAKHRPGEPHADGMGAS
jgi:hypothetical protein